MSWWPRCAAPACSERSRLEGRQSNGRQYLDRRRGRRGGRHPDRHRPRLRWNGHRGRRRTARARRHDRRRRGGRRRLVRRAGEDPGRGLRDCGRRRGGGSSGHRARSRPGQARGCCWVQSRPGWGYRCSPAEPPQRPTATPWSSAARCSAASPTRPTPWPDPLVLLLDGGQAPATEGSAPVQQVDCTPLGITVVETRPSDLAHIDLGGATRVVGIGRGLPPRKTSR